MKSKNRTKRWSPRPGWKLLPAALLAVLLAHVHCERAGMEKAGLVKVSDHVYAFVARGASAVEGLGANSGFVVGEEGVLVVDSRYTPSLARELLEAVRSVTGAPVRYLVNTHYHPDHTWGNSVFKDEGAVIIARPETRSELEFYSPVYMNYYKGNKPEAFERIKDVRVVLPDSTFREMLDLDLGGVDVVLHYFGPGHTAGDCIVAVPMDRVAFAGGLISNGYHPNLGDGGADFENWIEILGRLDAMDLRYIVPGQGWVCGPPILEKQEDYIQKLRVRCIEEIRRGGSAQEAALSINLPGTEGYQQANLLPFNVLAVYRNEIIDVVKPDFEFDLPEGFVINDGAVEGRGGRIGWLHDYGKGYMELEVQWQPTVRREVIVQDVYDRVSRYMSGDVELNMRVEGPRKINIDGEETVAAHGRWVFKRSAGKLGGGIWTWAMVIRNGTSYSIQLSTNAAGDVEREQANMKVLDQVASTFRIKGP